MKERFALPLVLFTTGLIVTGVHDYAYRRVDAGEGDYELGGFVSHAGSDMLILTIIVSVVALLWLTVSRDDRR